MFSVIYESVKNTDKSWALAFYGCIPPPKGSSILQTEFAWKNSVRHPEVTTLFVGHPRLLPEPLTEHWTPSSEFEKGAVQQQLEHLLASSLFHSSKRYAQFLRFVVGRALEGQANELKERILGIEVFDRPATYDTNTDPIVRVTAAEIRKRLDQYYQDPKHSQEIRLFLRAGSYVPQFSWPGHPDGFPETSPVVASVGSDLVRSPAELVPAIVSRRTRISVSSRTVAILLAAVILCAASMVFWRETRTSSLQQFW